MKRDIFILIKHKSATYERTLISAEMIRTY